MARQIVVERDQAEAFLEDWTLDEPDEMKR
jgi:hypothetical protein